MPKEPELKARDKVVVRMTREGAVEENLTAGTEQRVSKRLEDAELVKPVVIGYFNVIGWRVL